MHKISEGKSEQLFSSQDFKHNTKSTSLPNYQTISNYKK